MTFEEVKQAYLNDSNEYGLATEDQVQELSYWLESNDYANCAHSRYEDDQDEIRYLMEVYQNGNLLLDVYPDTLEK